MKFLPLLSLLGILVSINSCSADVITTINFNDAIWDVQTTLIGSDFGADPATPGAGLLEANKNGTGGGSVVITATLSMAISTAGYEGITLSFAHISSGNLEYNTANFTNASGDGFAITSSDGVSFSTVGANSSFRSALSSTPVWNTTNAPGFGQTLAFDSSVNDDQLTNLVFQLKVDGGNEFLRLSNVTLNGTAVTPEPGTFALMFFCAVGYIYYRRVKCVQAISQIR